MKSKRERGQYNVLSNSQQSGSTTRRYFCATLRADWSSSMRRIDLSISIISSRVSCHMVAHAKILVMWSEDFTTFLGAPFVVEWPDMLSQSSSCSLPMSANSCNSIQISEDWVRNYQITVTQKQEKKEGTPTKEREIPG